MFFREIYATSESLGSVCSLWSPQGISDHDKGLGPGFNLLFFALVFSTGGVSCGGFQEASFPDGV